MPSCRISCISFSARREAAERSFSKLLQKLGLSPASRQSCTEALKKASAEPKNSITALAVRMPMPFRKERARYSVFMFGFALMSYLFRFCQCVSGLFRPDGVSCHGKNKGGCHASSVF